MRIDKIGFALAMLAVFSQTAAAGIFGRRSCGSSCGHYVAPAVYSPPSTNIIFNNLYPSTFPLQGSSLYGVQAAASTYGDSPSLFMDRSARFTEMALELAKAGTEGFTETGRLALELNDAQDRRRHNAQVAALAMEANRGNTVQSLQIKIQDGQMSIVQPEAPLPPPEPFTLMQFANGSACATCHTGDKAPKGVVLDGTVRFDLAKAMEAVIAGKMPPKSSLTPAQKTAVVSGLQRMFNSAPGELE